MCPVKLYTYFFSSAAYRVRIALNLKGLAYEPEFIHLRNNGGEHKSPAYHAVNPLGLVPALTDGGATLIQSVAICEYLEERFPAVPLLPRAPVERAYVRALMQTVASEIHPVNNLRVLNHFKSLGHSQADADAWYKHWIAEGLGGFEKLLAAGGHAGACCFGDTPTLADAFLIPQVANAKRFNCPLDDYPLISRINEHCTALDPFKRAAPMAQPDAAA